MKSKTEGLPGKPVLNESIDGCHSVLSHVIRICVENRRDEDKTDFADRNQLKYIQRLKRSKTSSAGIRKFQRKILF